MTSITHYGARPLVPLLAFVAAVLASAGCSGDIGDPTGIGGGGGAGGGGTTPSTPAPPDLATLRGRVKAGRPMVRNLSNHEYLQVVSSLLGQTLSSDLVAGWTPTTQFSGFDAVPWTDLDTKAIRDRLATVEKIVDRALSSPTLLTCKASTAAQLPYDACARSIVEPLAKRAFGRPLADTERAALAKAYGRGLTAAQAALQKPAEIFVDALRAALGTLLMSPQLLHRIEAPPAAGFAGVRDLDSYELASRLALMFSASLPDDELWARAEDGTLSQPAVLRAQAERLIDKYSERFIKTFMGQWFDFRHFAHSPADSIERLMYEESWRTLHEVLVTGLPATAILEPGFAFVNKRLAAHYSMVGNFSQKLTKVATSERGGILQQGAWLTASSSELRTNPIHRGRLVQDRILCKVVPLPDASLFERIQKVQQSIPPDATVKQRVMQHRNADKVCQGCHEFMDPIGIGLEGFDMHGRLRRAYADTGLPVETDAALLGKPFRTFRELNRMLVELPAFESCVAQKLTIYATRRRVHADDDAALIAYLNHPVGGTAPSLREMVLRLVVSKAFTQVDHGAKP